jgi:hypothetical protein
MALLALCPLPAAGQQQPSFGIGATVGGQQQFMTGVAVTYGGGRAESLEYRVVSAEIIILGSMQPAAIGGGFVNITVLEAFKGSAPASQLTAMHHPDAPPLTPTPPGVQDIIFLKRIYLPSSGVHTSQELVVRSYVRLDEASGVYATDFTQLTDTDAIITATRRAIAFGQPKEPKTAVLLFPQPRVPQPRAAAAKLTPTYLAVPVDARLEAIARRWAENRDPHARVRAARALSNFPRSAENERLLRGMLSDPATPYAQGTGKWKRGVYAVRQEAYSTLTGWGADVQPPPFEGRMYAYDPAYLDWIFFVPIAILAWVLLGLAMQGGRFRLGQSLLGGLTFISVLLAAALVVLWVRSWFTVDELMYPAPGNAHHQVASYRGGLQYLVMLDADDVREGPVYGRFDLSTIEDLWGLDAHTPTARWEQAGFGFAVGRMTGPGEVQHRYRMVRVPYAALLVMALLLPATGTWRWWRGWRRVRRGLCQSCGYDMRASRGRCPECGEREVVAV